MTVSPELDRRNGRVYLVNYLLIFLAAPVMYVGVIQAALCNKLGASATAGKSSGFRPFVRADRAAVLFMACTASL